MHLNNLKPAWQQFRILNSMQSLDKEEILSIIQRAEDLNISSRPRFLINICLFVVLIVSCKGG